VKSSNRGDKKRAALRGGCGVRCEYEGKHRSDYVTWQVKRKKNWKIPKRWGGMKRLDRKET